MAALLLQSTHGAAQDLEDTIEDELGSSTREADASGADESIEDELAEEELDEGDLEENDVAGESDKSNEAGEDQGREDADEEAVVESLEIDEGVAETSPDGAEEDLATDAAESTESAEPPVAPSRDIYAETLGTFDDNVNSEFESRMYRIFSRPSPLNAASWESMVASQSQGVYRVQKGDTLWDISQTFFGDGSFWPKLWSENSDLTNPHEIVVGKGIAFVSGTEQDAPSVRVTDLRLPPSKPSAEIGGPSAPVYPDDPEARLSAEEYAAGTVLEEFPVVGGRPEIPEPLTPRKPVLRTLPPSFVEPEPARATRDFDSTGLDVGRRSAVDVPATVHLTSYLSDGVPSKLGVVAEIQAQETQASYLQYVIVTLDREAAVGQRFSVFMPRGNVSYKKSGSFGPIVDVGGTIEITEVIDSGRRAYRAMVIRSVMPIEPGAILSDNPLPTAVFSRAGTRSSVEARIIGGEFNSSRIYLGSGAVVYIDQGTNGGLQEGQVLAVRATRESRRPKTAFPNDSRPIAIVKIARALERVSTAILLESYGEVSPGDMTGGPLPLPERPVGSRRLDQVKSIEGMASDQVGMDYRDDTVDDGDDEDLEEEMN